MSLRRRTILFISLTFILLMLGMYLSVKTILSRNLAVLENKTVTEGVNRTKNFINNDLHSLESVGADWGSWDDTYFYADDHNKEYEDSNLDYATLAQLKINIMIIINDSGQVVVGKALDLQKGEFTPVPAGLFEKIQASPTLLRDPSSRAPQLGLIELQDSIMMLASYPILRSDGSGEVNGTILVGRYFDSVYIDKISKTIQEDISFEAIKDTKQNPELQAVLSTLSPAQPVSVKVLDQDLVAGYTLLSDINDQALVLLKVQMPRALYKQGQDALYYALGFAILIALFFGLITMLILEKLVLSRIYRLNQDVKHVTDSGFSSRVMEQGADELGGLAASMNKMLAELENSHLLLLENDAALRRITDNMMELVAQIDPKGNFVYNSPSVVKILGFSAEELNQMNFFSLVHSDDIAALSHHFKNDIDATGFGQAEFRTRKADGSYFWLELTGSAIYDETGQRTGIVLVGRDISFRKETEERIRYISEHDALTGLFNRNYFEQQMLAQEGPESIPLALLMCDLDGLKFINDTLGHKSGDDLISKAARIFQEACRQSSIIARIGGDEFAIMIPRCTQGQVDEAYSSIKQKALEHTIKYPDLPLSISIGYAIRFNNQMTMANLYREADNAMYREKVHSQQSGHSGIVASLMQALQERDFITGGHVDRIEKYSLALAAALQFAPNRLNDLRLFARFHDIGKVGVPDSLLLKPEPLSPEEYTEMKKHSEIGYRIARAASDLQPVAELILKHHEWWDGGGYPLGLKGEDIPLECRILAIADAYDAMTSNRPYREAMAIKDALGELKKCAGTQFDPHLIEVFIELSDLGNLA